MLNSWQGLLICFPILVSHKMCSTAATHLWPWFLVGWTRGYAKQLAGAVNLLPFLGRTIYRMGSIASMVCQLQTHTRQNHMLSSPAFSAWGPPPNGLPRSGCILCPYFLFMFYLFFVSVAFSSSICRAILLVLYRFPYIGFRQFCMGNFYLPSNYQIYHHLIDLMTLFLLWGLKGAIRNVPDYLLTWFLRIF